VKKISFKGNRLEAISDGVFAIAMTLLVLEMKLPLDSGSMSSEEFRQVMVGQIPNFISWLVSFTILCRLWAVQHSLLGMGGKMSTRYTTLNFVFLGAISFIPFPSSLISEHPEQVLSIMVFSMTITVAVIALGGMWFSLEDIELKADDLDAMNRRVRMVVIWTLVVAVASSLLSLVEARIGVLIWLAMPFIGIIRRIGSNKYSS